MTLRIVLTDGNGIAGLSGTFGSFLNTAAPDAAASAAAAKASATASANSATASANSATASANSATNASNSASQAATSASNASTSATNASNSATDSANSAGQAASSATAAGNSATAASTSATNASNSATSATNSATLSKNWATQMGSTVDGVEYSSKYYATQSQTSATNAANSATAAANSASSAAGSAGALNGELILDVSAADVVLNTTQLANGIFKFTGALTGNRKVTFPASPKTFTVQNLTTGIYTLTIIALGQTPSASVVQGKSSTLFSDATGVYATSAAAGMQFAAVYAQAGNFNVAINHLGAMIEQSTVGSTTTFPKANTYPAGSGFGYSNRSTGTTIIALQAGDTADLTFPYTTLTNDLYYWYSDGISVWKLGWYANKYGPKFDTGITFGDGTTQTTANSTTQPAGQWYVVGPTDTVGSFADGDTAIRTSGFTAPFVRVIKNGLVMTRGQHFTLNADNIHVNFTEPLSKLDELNVETQGVYNPSSTYLPGMTPLLPAAGASFIAFAHTVGFAWLMQRGVWLEPGVDYTEDATGFTLVGFTADGVEKFFVFNLNAIGIANALAATNPVIKSGVLTFADGSTQNTAPLSNRNYIVDGNFDSWINASVSLGAGAYNNGAATMFWCFTGTGGAATVSRGSFAAGSEPAGMTTPVANYLSYNQTTAATSTPQLYQDVEGVRTLAGRSATFSCWLWVASGTMTISAVQFAQVFGTGGSPSGGVYPNVAVNWAVTTTPKRFSVRMDIPSIAGKTLGTNGNDYLNISFILPTGVTFNLNTAQWQLEQSSPNSSSDLNGNGGSPTSFEYRGPQAEAARIGRYYQGILTYFHGYGPAGQPWNSGFSFPVPMRATPAVNVGTPSYANASGYAVVTLDTSGFAASINITAVGAGLVNAKPYFDARL